MREINCYVQLISRNIFDRIELFIFTVAIILVPS